MTLSRGFEYPSAWAIEGVLDAIGQMRQREMADRSTPGNDASVYLLLRWSSASQLMSLDWVP